MDSKLRWGPHIQYLLSFTSRWVNIFLLFFILHSSSLLLVVYKAIVRARFDYGSFLFGAACKSIRFKLNSNQDMCLRSIIGVLLTTPHALEVKLCVPPLDIRARWLGSEFLLKKLYSTFHHDSIPAFYLSIFRA